MSFAASGVWRLLVFDAEPSYVTAYLPAILFSGLGVALTIPQLASAVAQSLPPNRLGVGGAANQALRQFGGTFGVSLTIGFLGRPESLGQALTRFDQVWWVLVVAGLGSALLSSRLRTGAVAPSRVANAGVSVEVGDGAIAVAAVGPELRVVEAKPDRVIEGD